MYYACTGHGKKRYEFKIFQQLVFMSEFGKATDNQAQSDSGEDPIDLQFRGLMSRIKEDAYETALKTLTKSSFHIM